MTHQVSAPTDDARLSATDAWSPAAVERPSDDSASNARTTLLGLIVVCGGFTSIGMELAASRLIGPYFGSSTFIWANLIGVTLAFLSLGYYVGGRVADRWPRAQTLYLLTTVAALGCGLVPFVARPILRSSLAAFDSFDVGAFYGSLLVVLLLFALPLTLLGFVTPYAIRLRLASVAGAGNTAGRVYALSTLGSIAGSFLPVIVLIPLVGTARTFLLLSLSLLLPSLLGLLVHGAPRLAVGATLLAAVVLGFTSSTDAAGVRPAERGRLLYEVESEYNYIQVVEEDGARLLVLNEGHAVHSVYHPDRLLTRGPWDYFMVGPLFNPGAGAGSVDNALLIGLAGGTAARQLTAAYGPIPIDGVEIDPEIARVGRDYFGLDAPESANVNVIVEDGRYFLRTTDRTYDLIGVDAYRQPYIPFQLTSREFFEEMALHLSDDGVAVVNAGRTDDDFRLVDALAATMGAVFPHVYAIDVERYNNTILVGANAPAGGENFAANVATLPVDSVLRTVGERSLITGQVREMAPTGRVFTDDHAPVELVVDRIILDEAREGAEP